MMDNNPDVFVYLLIDNSLLNEVSASYSEADSTSRPLWLMPIYPDSALAVSPLLIDVEAAYEAGDLDKVMSYLNVRKPALHVSIIETELDLERISQHLRRFIFILDAEGKQFTLRYADCAVLEALSLVLHATQWATMRGPIKSWKIHDRSDALIQLPISESITNGPTPLYLDHNQLRDLDEASEPDHCIAKVKMMRNGVALPGNSAEHHKWAQASRRVWREAGNPNRLILMFLTEAVLLTKGEVLQLHTIHTLLAMDEVGEFRRKLRGQVDEILKSRS